MELMQRKRRGADGETPNRTGIPMQMKREVESRTGLSLDDVRVHYASSRPAGLGALAYTQGSQVYIGPGQERHLRHELGHVVQQKRGLVRPVGTVGGLPLNDDPALERQAESGAFASGGKSHETAPGVVQRKVGFEFQTVGGGVNVMKKIAEDSYVECLDHGLELLKDDGSGVDVTGDCGDVEYVTVPAEDPTHAERLGAAAAEKHRALRRRTGDISTDHGIYKIVNLGNAAHPQATAGVKIVNIPWLLKKLAGLTPQYTVNRAGTGVLNTGVGGQLRRSLSSSWLGGRSAVKKAQLLGEQTATLSLAVSAADTAVRKLPMGETRQKIRALLTMLGACNRQFCIIYDHPAAAENAKNAMPVMLRTSFYEMYRDIVRLPNGAAEFAAAFREMEGQWRACAGKRILAGQRRDGVWSVVTVDEWYRRITGVPCVDILANRYNGIGEIISLGTDEDRQALEDKYGLTDAAAPLDLDLGAPAVLAELRGLERRVDVSRWSAVAKAIAELIDDVNGIVRLPQLPQTRRAPQAQMTAQNSGAVRLPQL